LILLSAPIALGMALSTPAVAQNTQARNLPFNGTACPAGYERGSYQTPSRNNTNICYDRRSDAARSNVSTTKPNRLDRCPLAYFTSDANPMACTSRLVDPPTIRIKGSSPCRAGEIEDWGVWCVSNYANLTRGQAATALRDWNAIYTLNSATSPRQEDLPEGSQYTPAYITIFGRVKEDGSPMEGGSNAALAPNSTASTADLASNQTVTTAPATNPNCPVPASGNASAAGQALGGLLGGRRGNSQVGAALGGLLGQVAAGAGRPAGC
jgi:hypothetical protein